MRFIVYGKIRGGDYETRVRVEARKRWSLSHKPINPVILKVIFQFKRPKGCDEFYHTKAPDLGYLENRVVEALQGVICEKRQMIVGRECYKQYYDEERTIIEIIEVDKNEVFFGLKEEYKVK
jgi:Holliday junction resolvase RusA-like endonuclease